MSERAGPRIRETVADKLTEWKLPMTLGYQHRQHRAALEGHVLSSHGFKSASR